MSRLVKLTLTTIVAAVLSGAYWLAFLMFAEVFTAADYRYGTAPSEAVLWWRSALVVIGGPAAFAILIAGWRWLERGLSSGSRMDL